MQLPTHTPELSDAATATLVKLANTTSLATSMAVSQGVEPHQAIYAGLVSALAHADVSMEDIAALVEECRALRERVEMAAVETGGSA